VILPEYIKPAAVSLLENISCSPPLITQCGEEAISSNKPLWKPLLLKGPCIETIGSERAVLSMSTIFRSRCVNPRMRLPELCISPVIYDYSINFIIMGRGCGTQEL